MAELESGLPVTFAEGVRDDIAGLIAIAAADPKVVDAAVEELKRRIAGLLIECRDNPYLGELPLACRRTAVWAGRPPQRRRTRSAILITPRVSRGRRADAASEEPA